MADDSKPAVPTAPQSAVPELTHALDAASSGNRAPLDALLPLIYDELRMLARRYMRHESAAHTLQATAVANEAYLRLVGSPQLAAGSRAQFFAAAATAIRRILVDHARARNAEKRGGGRDRVALSLVDAAVAFDDRPDGGEVDVLALNVALDRLNIMSSRAAKVVELRFFGGMSVEQAAEAMGVSPRTVAGDWVFARAWLRRELQETNP